MLVTAKAGKVLICTSSNVALDEIVRKLSQEDGILAKVCKGDLLDTVVRVGSTEYNPPEEIDMLQDNEFDGETFVLMEDVTMFKECGFEESFARKIINAVEKWSEMPILQQEK